MNNVNGTKTMRWHYHHLGSQPIAANREVVVGTSTTVARFWCMFDERGPIHRALDQNGLEHCRAHYDASGWHTVDVQATDMWLPVLARPARRSPSTPTAPTIPPSRPRSLGQTSRRSQFAFGGSLSVPETAESVHNAQSTSV